MARRNEFDAGQIGPEEAHRLSGLRSPYLVEMGEKQRRDNPRLFPVGRTDYMLEPHQQTRAQFANDPRTWWHGRYSEQLPRTGGARNAGIHVGTFGSSDKRRHDLGPSRKFKDTYDNPQPWRSFPVRLRGETSNWVPEEGRLRPGHDEGRSWRPKQDLHFYTNAVEDSGSISALAPGRQFLQTHPQAIKEAKKAGKSVHPNIEWEAKQLGRREYDPDKVDPREVVRQSYRAGADATMAQDQLFSTAPYNEGRQERTARRRKTAIDAGVTDYARYAIS